MSDFDMFEHRLGDALRLYAADAPIQVDAVGFARAIARGKPRRSGWSAALILAGRPVLLRWVLLGILLILASLIALAAVGSFLYRNDRLSLDPNIVVPDELYGDWLAEIAAAGPSVAGGTYTVDLKEASLIRAPDGREIDWAGRAVELVPTRAGLWELLVRSPGARCGDGRYSLYGPGPAPDGIEFVARPLEFHEIADKCVDRLSILTGAPAWTRPQSVPLTVGEVHGSNTFSEPFHFVVPFTDPTATMRLWGTAGGLQIGYGCCWESWFLDDQPVNLDVCEPTKGRLPDVPATPEAVGEWLRSSLGLKVSDPIEVPVDGRTALRFDIESFDTQTSHANGCDGFALTLSPPSVFVGFRYYAIPTGDDTILYVVWSDPGSYPSVEAGAEALVRSITFDEN